MIKGEDIEIQTKKIDEAQKNLRHLKKLEEIKAPKQSLISLKIAIATSEAIFTVRMIQKRIWY